MILAYKLSSIVDKSFKIKHDLIIVYNLLYQF